jgi:hydrogenase maturation protein HypF
MATTDREAGEHLAGAIADALLLHDRAIANRCDDSVARVLGGEAVVLRRGRGWVPASLTLPSPTPTALLASGAHLKNTFCYAEGGLAWLGPHVGDLETHEACADYEAMIERFGRFVGITPQAIACDLHPDYFSTRWANEYASQRGIPLVQVQHHHAHVAAAMVEHGLRGPVLGLAWDGTGDGGDGTAWGGELLLANYAGFKRLATFRPIPLAGGDRAIREVWRIALAVVDDAFNGAPPLGELALFQQIEADQIRLVRDMIGRRLRCPSAHGVGRWFDAVGALLLDLPQSRFEGEVAMRLGFAAAAFGAGDLPPAYSFDVDASGACAVIDLRPTVRAAIGDLIEGHSAARVSARFHATLIEAASGALRRARRQLGDLPVVLTGGCFQNALLLGGIGAAAGSDGPVFTHRQVPPNDGGIALGQAAIAAAVLNGDPGPGRGSVAASEGES